MKLKDIIAVSGLPGLYRVKTNRSNGLIIEDLQTGKSKFASSRKHQFTPLESIGLFTTEDTIDLIDVFKRISANDTHIPSTSSAESEIISYFEHLIPNYDRDKVFIKDMKKVIKWYQYLHQVPEFRFHDEEE